jgi:hypothetical protein
MDTTRNSRPGPSPRRFGDVSPSEAAEAELSWFFDEAASAIDMPSNCCLLLEGRSATTLGEQERRIEALHAAGKIYRRLQALKASDVIVLSALYTEEPITGTRRDVERACAAAVRAYDLVRGSGPSVVPEEEG